MPVHAALLGVDLMVGRWVMRSLCPSMASARLASLLPPGPTPRAWAWHGFLFPVNSRLGELAL